MRWQHSFGNISHKDFIMWKRKRWRKRETVGYEWMSIWPSQCDPSFTYSFALSSDRTAVITQSLWGNDLSRDHILHPRQRCVFRKIKSKTHWPMSFYIILMTLTSLQSKSVKKVMFSDEMIALCLLANLLTTISLYSCLFLCCSLYEPDRKTQLISCYFSTDNY